MIRPYGATRISKRSDILAARLRARRLPPEEKYRIIPLNTSALTSIGNSWREIALEQIAQGTDVTNRLGDRIWVTSVEFTGVLVGGQSGTVADDSYNTVRFVLGSWDGYNNQTPLATGGQTISSPLDKTLCRSLDKIHLDKMIILGSPNSLTTGYQPAVKHFSFVHRFKKPLEIQYTGSSTGTSNKSINFGAISDSTAVPHPGFVSGFIKFNFIDA